jgi:uncharacterized membrane protein YhiD involved in acid resistance
VHDPALQLAIFGRMALAASLGFLVGFEREARGKAAGERTIALIAAGAAAFASLASEAFPKTGGQIFAGVGFYLTAILATAITLLILELEFMPWIGGLPHRMASGSDRSGEPQGSPDPEHE